MDRKGHQEYNDSYKGKNSYTLHILEFLSFFLMPWPLLIYRE
jgi:hypothetical protein